MTAGHRPGPCAGPRPPRASPPGGAADGGQVGEAVDQARVAAQGDRRRRRRASAPRRPRPRRAAGRSRRWRRRRAAGRRGRRPAASRRGGRSRRPVAAGSGCSNQSMSASGQQEARRRRASRERLSADRVGDRVDQQLHRRPAARLRRGRSQADDGGEVAAGAVAADRDPGRVGAELAAVAHRPSGRRRARRRPRPGRGARGRAGSRPRGRARRSGRRGSGRRVVGLEVADHPAAAVEVDEQRPVRGLARRAAYVEAGRQRRRRPRDRQARLTAAIAACGGAARRIAVRARISARACLDVQARR